MAEVCKICNQGFPDDTAFHKHLRKHKLTMAPYYQTHWPRHDKVTGGLILFKSKEYYFTTDFNSKANLLAWLKSQSDESALAYIEKAFLQRKNAKNLIYAPSQVELRSLMLPGMKYIKDRFGDYYKFCARLGFVNRFSKYVLEGKPANISRRKIFVDTRERKPLTFKLKTIPAALKFGDYALKDGDDKKDCYIERKALGDLYGTLSNGYERFCREIERAVAANAYLIVLVESDFKSVYEYPKLPQLHGRVKISPEYIFHHMRELVQKYPNIQFLFVNNRAEASRVIERLFACDEEFKDVDLQFAYDTQNL